MSNIEIDLKEYLDDRFNEVNSKIDAVQQEIQSIKECKHCKNEKEFKSNFQWHKILIFTLYTIISAFLVYYFVSKPDALSAKEHIKDNALWIQTR